MHSAPVCEQRERSHEAWDNAQFALPHAGTVLAHLGTSSYELRVEISDANYGRWRNAATSPSVTDAASEIR